MEHSFDVEVAKEVGINAAILYKNIQFWCAKNKANETHFHDGYYWTYNSKKAFAELFPYMTERQIEYALKKLVDADLIMKGNYNTSPYDKTNWYTDKTTNVVDGTNLCDGTNKSVQPIPYSKQSNINTVVLSKDNTTSNPQSDFSFGKRKQVKPNLYQNCLGLINDFTDDCELREKLREYLDLRLQMKDKSPLKYQNQWKGMLNKLKELSTDKQTMLEIIDQSIVKGWANFFEIQQDKFSKNNIERITGMQSNATYYADEDHTKSTEVF